jgi:hypothetical protein
MSATLLRPHQLFAFVSTGLDVGWVRMNSDSSSFVSEIWRDKPIIIVLAIGGMILLILLVIDAYRHRKKRKDRHKRLH